MPADILYSDTLVEISAHSILFRQYYFPVGSRRINLNEVESVRILKPTFMQGKWRIHGTGDFRTWFPRDMDRPSRDAIFLLKRRKGWWRIGFTVEDANLVKDILTEYGLNVTEDDGGASL